MKKEQDLGLMDIEYSIDNAISMCVWGDINSAFIKSEMVDNNEVWKIYSADGMELGVTDNRDFAFVIAKQNDLEPKSAH